MKGPKSAKNLPMLLATLVLLFSTVNAVAKQYDESPIIGIDLGDSFTSVGVYENDIVTIIPNEYGSKRTPSYVAFTDNEIIVGEAAKNFAKK